MAPAWLGLLVLLATPTATEAPPADAPAAVLDRIQRECLRAYPRELLWKATGATAIPAPVDADPAPQMQFLDRDVELKKGTSYPSLLPEVWPPFQRYISAGTGFLDLGSGDGRAVFLAAHLGAAATGLAYDEALAAASRRALEALPDLIPTEGVRIVQGDFFDQTWSGYDVVYYFDLGSCEQERMREKMRRELDLGAVLIVGHEQIPFPGLEVLEPAPSMCVYRQPVPAEAAAP